MDSDVSGSTNPGAEEGEHAPDGHGTGDPGPGAVAPGDGSSNPGPSEGGPKPGTGSSDPGPEQ